MSIAAPARPLPAQWRRATRWPVSVHLYMAGWVAGIAVVGTAVAAVVWSIVGDVDRSILGQAHQPVMWLVFGVTISNAYSLVRPYVAGGLTRRAVAAGQLVTVVPVALAYSLALIVALLIERLVYEFMGWPHLLPLLGSGENMGTLAEVGLVPLFLVCVLALTLLQVSASTIGISYYRLGGGLGTLLLPLTAGPAVAGALVLFGSVSAPSGLTFMRELPIPLVAAIAALLVAAYAAAYVLLTRRVPISAGT